MKTTILTAALTISLAAGLSYVRADEPDTQPSAQAPANSHKTADGLIIADKTVGTGPAVNNGDSVTVNYTGWLQSTGKKFDSSLDRNQPFQFTVGNGDVIKGWDEGLVGMKVGGKRELIIPPDLGYGADGQGPIPPNSTLIFDIELLKIGQ
ncbi:MAG TPA: FKBP-type peptidyl-prolyl cis-trans isomerase [Tepidisphaeraceae bacterium]|nr:FKBP-type peptidyl-prolyl cis-trans isomerase [Tepidisphaeraceae bacterium]